jgi:hypothetical protein
VCESLHRHSGWSTYLSCVRPWVWPLALPKKKSRSSKKAPWPHLIVPFIICSLDSIHTTWWHVLLGQCLGLGDRHVIKSEAVFLCVGSRDCNPELLILPFSLVRVHSHLYTGPHIWSLRVENTHISPLRTACSITFYFLNSLREHIIYTHFTKKKKKTKPSY